MNTAGLELPQPGRHSPGAPLKVTTDSKGNRLPHAFLLIPTFMSSGISRDKPSMVAAVPTVYL